MTYSGKRRGPKPGFIMGRRLDDKISLRLPGFVRDRIDEAREEYGQSRSEFIRGLLINYFRNMTMPVVRDSRPLPRWGEEWERRT